jgi:catechol 2,3-dioxygenase-like lactoylglutathione lyase family enzyme
MIKVRDIAFVRFGAPDLDAMERFAHDFGLVPTERSDDTLYCRGTDPEPYVHVTERGEPGFRGVAFEAASAADLEAAAKLDGASPIEPLPGPGGGQRVRFTDPDGYPVEVVHGRELLAPLPVRKPLPLNRGSDVQRRGERQHMERGPAQVKSIGHCVLIVSDFKTSDAWYKSRFGFVDSDRVYLGDPEKLISAFMRCDRGDEPVDHHTFLCVGLGEPRFEHAAFEVEDFDTVMLGHDHLQAAGYEHHSGIGRHLAGSQIFDYWKDPWGHTVEHFTDGDLLDASVEPNLVDPPTVLGTWWGGMAR